MLVIFIALWIIAGILIRTDPHNRATRWGSALAFFSGFGGLGIILREYSFTLSETNTKFILYSATSLLFTLSTQIAPYIVLIYSIIYSGVFNNLKFIYKYCRVIFFIPVIIMYFIYPAIPDYRPSFLILSLWVVPYVLFANYLLIYSYSAEKNARKKQQRLLTCILITPTTLFAITANYILRALQIENIWRYNAITISVAFIIFVYASFKYGVMGVRVKFEKYRLDSTIKAITSGTSIMNHSIKNEIIKIGMCTNTIKSYLKNQNINIPDIDENIGFILDSSDYLTKMVKHIQKHIQEITLNEQVNNVKDIFKSSINMVIPFIKSKEIILENNFDNDIFIKCDCLHIQEVFHNVLKNAIEAMDKAGKLKIDTVSNKSTFIIAISDTGCGISKENLPYVFDPFFSTKRTSNNFGLGLSYCVNVMNLHGGKLEAVSEKNVGTTIQIIFHKSRVSDLVDRLIKRSLVNG